LDDGEDIVLRLRAMPDSVPVARPRLASLLKRLGRAFGFRCVGISWEPRAKHRAGQSAGERRA
jgi:hypothetical protein